MVYLMHIAAASVVVAAPPVDGGDELLRDFASGARLGTLAFSEKGSRSHFWAPVSQTTRITSDAVALKADKSWVTSANRADVYVASCLAPGSETPMESNLYVVNRRDAGVKGNCEGSANSFRSHGASRPESPSTA